MKSKWKKKDDYNINLGDKVRIEVYSDIGCPWCHLGFARLQKIRMEAAMQGVETILIY